jgi:hypothetical protein
MLPASGCSYSAQAIDSTAQAYLSNFSEHRFPGVETFPRGFEFRESAAFLLDEEILDAADGFSGGHQLFPRRHAFSEQNFIALILRPILQVHAFDAARVCLHPDDGVGARFFASADVQLQRKFLGRIGGDHFEDALAALQLRPFGLMIVLAGR